MSKLRNSIICLMALVAVGGVMLTGCASSKGAVAQDDVGLAGDWKLTSVLHSGAELAIPQDVAITFSADVPKMGSYDYDVYGFSGVNNYSGPVTIEGSAYSAGPFAITMMAGSPELETFERLYLETLSDADQFRIATDGHGMEISKSSGETALLFQKMMLAGTHWLLTAYYDGTGVGSLDQSKAVPELVFGTKLDVSGFSGSNFVVGSYEVDYAARTIAFQEIGTIKEAAPVKEAAIMEQVYLNLLGKASHYVLSGNTFQLIGKDGTTLLVFTAK